MAGDLLVELREHDLPPRWDGLVVRWGGWEYQSCGVFICPPPKPRDDVCPGCKAPLTERGFPTRSVNRGEVAIHPGVTLAHIEEREASRERLPFLVKGKLGRLAWMRLVVYRCPECQLDEVWDIQADEWWTLDHTDYGPEGSVAPGRP